MKFSALGSSDQVKVMKTEFTNMVKSLFDNPEQLKQFVNDKKISIEQAKSIIVCVNRFNAMECGCCRRFEPQKLNAVPLDKNLEPILDLVQENIRRKEF
jgi:hypothetical protein